MGRSSGKVTLARRARAAALALSVLANFGVGSFSDRALAGDTERVVVDPTSGIAIFGFDPVSYFLDGKPRAGSSKHEFVWSGATWRFATAGNLEAFRRDAVLYAPAYGGYDAARVAQELAVTSDPTIFAIIDQRLFLFRSVEARSRFNTGSIAAADEAWPRLRASLGQ